MRRILGRCCDGRSRTLPRPDRLSKPVRSEKSKMSTQTLFLRASAYTKTPNSRITSLTPDSNNPNSEAKYNKLQEEEAL